MYCVLEMRCRTNDFLLLCMHLSSLYQFNMFVFQELSIARKNAKTNKRLALQALKRKKRYDRQLQQVRKGFLIPDGFDGLIDHSSFNYFSGSLLIFLLFGKVGQAGSPSYNVFPVYYL